MTSTTSGAHHEGTISPPLPVTAQPGGLPEPLEGLPQQPLPADADAPWWWVGCHGGAGVSTLGAALPPGRPYGRAWPQPGEGASARVVLVARSSAVGLIAAQAAIRQWAGGACPRVELLGLAVLADAPGRLPKPLQELIALLAGGVPHLWVLPWVEALRVTPPRMVRLPRAYRALADQLSRRLT